jgi:hypothetical protein
MVALAGCGAKAPARLISKPMRFPIIREWVRIEGQEGNFLVVAVDRARGVAGVIAADGQGGVVVVQLDQVQPLGRGKGSYGGSGESG